MSTAQIQQMILQAAQQYGVPPNLALGVAAHESGFNPNATNHNTNGTTDWGVMQLNDTTVQTLGVSNPLDPQQNINAGVGLLASLLQKYQGNQQQALWAYASGSGNVVPGGTPNPTAQGFINYVTSYQPSIDTGAPAADPSTLDPNAILSDLGLTSDPSQVQASALDFSNPVVWVGLLIAGGVLWAMLRD